MKGIPISQPGCGFRAFACQMGGLGSGGKDIILQ